MYCGQEDESDNHLALVGDWGSRHHQQLGLCTSDQPVCVCVCVCVCMCVCGHACVCMFMLHATFMLYKPFHCEIFYTR